MTQVQHGPVSLGKDNEAECILWGILAAVGKWMPADTIPTLPEFKDFKHAGTLRPGVQQYVDRWNDMKPDHRVQANEVYSVLSLVFKIPVTAAPAAASSGAAGAASVSNATTDHATSAKLDGLIACLQNCQGDLKNGMRNFMQALARTTGGGGGPGDASAQLPQPD